MEGPDVCHIDSLPSELIRLILGHSSLEDASSFSQTCCKFRKIVEDRRFWMDKLCEQWKCLVARRPDDVDWYKMYWEVKQLTHSCWCEIQRMSGMYYWSDIALPEQHLKEFVDRLDCCQGSGYDITIEFLRKMSLKNIFYPDATAVASEINLTNQYYCLIILDYLVQSKLKTMWRNMCNDGANPTPEKVTEFFTEWIEPKCPFKQKKIFQKLSVIIKKIEKSFPSDHPLFKIDESERARWSTQLLQDNYFNRTVCEDIMNTVRDGLKKHKFILKADTNFSSIFNANKEECGAVGNFLLSPIYFSCALRHFGVRCDIFYFSNHRFLIWRENWSRNSPVFFIDSYDNKMRQSQNRCPYASQSEPYVYNSAYLLISLAESVMTFDPSFNRRSYKNSAELMHFVEPGEIMHLLALSPIYVYSRIDLRPLKSTIRNMIDQRNDVFDHEYIQATHALGIIERMLSKESYPIRETRVKERTEAMQFAVGLICVHKMFQYYCVIRGWDSMCQQSAEWKEKMGVSRLQYGELQPFYEVLAVDLSERYVAQENLIVVSPCTKLFDAFSQLEELLGIEFSHYNGYFYIPNEEKEKEYPADGAVRERYTRKWNERQLVRRTM